MTLPRPVVVCIGIVVLGASGCSRITARNLDKTANEADGIPFYLPKPYLIVSKNVRYIPTPTVGLTAPVPVPDAFDATAKELTMTAAIQQQRTLTMERKLAEENKFERLEKDILEQKIEQKFERLEEDKFQKTVDEKFERIEEDKKSVEERLERLEEDKQSVTTDRTENNSNPSDGNPTDPSEPELQAGKKDQKDKPSGAGTDQEGGAGTDQAGGVGARGVATHRQVLGITNQSVVPAGQIPDGLVPQTFYTYQVVYLPDLTQKYGLQIHGGPGELRATMNLVNGWMHTGAGPIYMKDSTTAARTVAAGAAIGNIIDSLAGLGFATAGPMTPAPTSAAIKSIIPGVANPIGEGPQLQAEGGPPSVQRIPNYAELYIFEPVLEEKLEGGLFSRRKVKTVRWRLITEHALGRVGPIQMRRDYLALGETGPSTAGDSGVTLEIIRAWVKQEHASILPGLKDGDGNQVIINDVKFKKPNVILIQVSAALADETVPRGKLQDAAEKKWPGIDISHIAYRFVVDRNNHEE